MAIQHTLQLSVQVGTVRTYSYTMYRTRLTVSAARDDRDRETPHTSSTIDKDFASDRYRIRITEAQAPHEKRAKEVYTRQR